MMNNTRPISAFMERHYLHFNAAAMMDAAKAYKVHKAAGKKMLISLAGAMSTAELGKSLAEMIRAGQVDIISCTGANLEEDVMNLVAHDHYERVPHYRDLTKEDEQKLYDQHLNRVTDTCIPEEAAMRKTWRIMEEQWSMAEAKGERCFPHEFFYRALLQGKVRINAGITMRPVFLLQPFEQFWQRLLRVSEHLQQHQAGQNTVPFGNVAWIADPAALLEPKQNPTLQHLGANVFETNAGLSHRKVVGRADFVHH